MADENDVLFEITRAHLNTGLRGFPVGTCRTSKVDPEKGVSYVGYPITELADQDPEAVVYLLLHRDLPDADELAAFKGELREHMGLPPEVLGHLKRLPRDGHPMEWLVAGITLAGMTSKRNDPLEDATNLIARSAELVAAIFRIRSGWGDPIAPDPELDFIENFVHMLGVPGGDDAKLIRLLRTFYILHMDHGGGNLSTFTGKAVASAGTHVYASMAAAMAGLYGPLHGRANQNCLDFVKRVGNPDPDHVEKVVREAFDSGEKIPGFGHAVLRAEDPRAKIEYAIGQELFADDELFQTALTMRTVVPKVLSEHPKISNPYPNVDAVSGSLLNAAGLTDSDYYTCLFGLARIAGISSQIVDERLRLRGGGKAVPIYRPKYIAQDQPARSLSD